MIHIQNKCQTFAENPNSPPSPILWGIPEVVEKRLSGISEIYFERRTVTFPILSPNHFWEHMSKRYGPLTKYIKVLENPDDPNEPESLRDGFLKVIGPYVIDNGIRLGYLLTMARK